MPTCFIQQEPYDNSISSQTRSNLSAIWALARLWIILAPHFRASEPISLTKPLLWSQLLVFYAFWKDSFLCMSVWAPVTWLTRNTGHRVYIYLRKCLTHIDKCVKTAGVHLHFFSMFCRLGVQILDAKRRFCNIHCLLKPPILILAFLFLHGVVSCQNVQHIEQNDTTGWYMS